MNIALKDFEHIRQVYRQTPFVLAPHLFFSGLAFLLPAYIALRFDALGTLRTLLIIWLVLVLGHIIRMIIIWRLNTYVVTNQRLLHYAQTGLFDQTVTETPHERILNVSYKSSGLFSTVIGFGHVIVQVVGLMEPIILKNINNPMAIKDYLWEMHKRLAQDKSNTVFAETDATHIQEQVGYTKKNQL